MSDDNKTIALVCLYILVAVLTLLSWGIIGAMNNHNFDVVCIKSGKTIQYRTLQGQQTSVKECK